MSVKTVFYLISYILCALRLGIEATPTAAPSYDTTTTEETNYVPPSCFGIGYDFAYETRRCYKFHFEFKAWIDAREVCKNEGGELAIMNSEAEARVVIAMFTRYPAETIVNGNTYQKEWAYLGFYYSTNGWITVEGQPFEETGYTNKKYEQDPFSYPFGIINRAGRLSSANHEPSMFICEKGPQEL